MPEGPDGELQLPFSTHISAPLPELLREINKTSDNLAARNLMLALSRAERAKPRAFVDLLAKAWQARQATSLIDSLPVASRDGTLEHRMTRGAAAGQAFLKTGTLLDTRALSGYVKGRSGRTYAVAALVNHPDAGRATPALDALIEWLARS
jgi:serine-type D-Ala-D-Ala carboxypeptidase/endopeptidase (penicillin-binding protein 4)